VLSRKLTLAAVSAALALAALPAAADADPGTFPSVCNEAENSWQGGYTVTDSGDPNPPAFLRGSQMRVGNGRGAGLENAAAHSPALALCAPPSDDGGGSDGGGQPG
jgi:ABC-type sugar transport system substrate-binding protein